MIKAVVPTGRFTTTRSAMPSVDVTEAKRQFDELLRRVSLGEEIVITENDRPLARLTAPSSSTPQKQRQFGRVEGEIWMSDDFDEPLW